MFNLPNLLTLLNLLCGCLAIVSVFAGDARQMLLFFGASLLFDLLDGLAARALNAQSPFGAQLDSLADMVSFGALPGILLFNLLQGIIGSDSYTLWPTILGFIYTMAAALRLAKFNLDDRQSIDFMGLNTPAASIAIVGFYINAEFGNCDPVITYLSLHTLMVLAFTLIISALLLVDIPMLSFKVKLKDRRRTTEQIILLLVGAIILFFLRTCALPFLILWYILFSLLRLIIEKTRR